MFRLNSRPTEKKSSLCKKWWLVCGCAAQFLIAEGLPTQLYGDEKPRVAPKSMDEADHALVQRLLTEVAELRARVRELESLEAGRANGGQITGALEQPAAAAPVAVPSPIPAQTGETLPGGPAGLSGVQLKLFGDVGYHATNLRGDTNTFYIGSLDMFMTGELTDRVSILGEVLFTSAADNSMSVDVERLLVQYKPNDYFQFGVGRFHTAIGYYNPTFHRGAWFQTAIGRPFMYEFDDNGGFLPLQDVGVTVSENLPWEKLGLHYTAEVGNGRAHILGSDPAQNNKDVNNGKAVNFALTSQPRSLPGWQTGFSISHDYLTFSDNINHPELIVTGHLVYTSPTYEFLNEAMVVRHKYSSSGAPGVFHTPGFYTQISRRFGKYRPYFRYSYINAANDEPIYGDPADGFSFGRRNGPSVGIRWEFNEHAAVKLQYDRTALRQKDLNTSYNGIATEFSFAF